MPVSSLRNPAEPLRRAWAEAAQLLLPQYCAGCAMPAVLLCEGCRRQLRPAPLRRTLHCADGGTLPVVAGLPYQAVIRSCILAFKEQHRTGLAGQLAPVLAAALFEAAEGLLTASGQSQGAVGEHRRGSGALAPASAPFTVRLLVAAVPSTAEAFRERGFWPMRVLLRRLGLRSAPVLKLLRGTADQARLGRGERSANLAGALLADHRVRGRSVLLLDDVVTTGATLLEARRALLAAGAERVHAAVLAATPLRVMRASLGSEKR